LDGAFGMKTVSKFAESDGAIKPSVLRERYRGKIDGYRMQVARAESVVADAMQRVRQAQMGGDAAHSATAIDSAMHELRAKLGVLGSQLADPDLDAADRSRIESERDKTGEAIERLSSEREIAPLERTAQIDRAAANDGMQAYRDDLRLYGTGPQTDADLARERDSLAREAGADSALAGSNGGWDQARFGDQSERIGRQIGDVAVQDAVYSPPPSLESEYLQERGELQRSDVLGDVGDAADARTDLMRTVAQMIQGLRGQFDTAASAPGLSSADRAKMELEYERQLQPLLDQQAQIERADNRAYAERIPELTIGGESFSMRYLPSPAQAAEELDERVSGSSRTSLGVSPGRGFSNPGVGLIPGVSGAPVPVRLVGGDITVTVNVPGVGKMVSRVPVASVQKSSETSGMGSHYPGM
jgi:hypothetical protein